MNYAGILAGGRGARMGHTQRPKQFLTLNEHSRPIIIVTLQTFLACDAIDHIVVASPTAWMEYTEVLLAENLSEDEAARVHVIAGGKERFDSLDNICTFIEQKWGLTDDDILVSHDAVRPFVTERIIRENIEFARIDGCVDTVVAATDTIVVSKNGKGITSIPSRSDYYLGQTPQTFFIKEYLKAFDSLDDKQRAQLTDACKVYIMCGKPVHLVMGEYFNIKITTAHDIYVAQRILRDFNTKQPISQELSGQ